MNLRFARELLWEFRWPIGVTSALVLGGGFVLHHCYHHEHLSYPKAFHAVFLMIFFGSGLEFPDEWYLQPLFFIVPIVGLGAVADSVVRLAYLMFTAKQKLPEWQRMVASLYRNHIVVVGAGKVGYQIVTGLLALRESVVAVELKDDSPLIQELMDRGVPLIRGNARNPKTLEQAGVREARSVILSTSDDLTNLDAALTARDLNPTARIVLRLFDASLAAKVAGAFAMPAISTSEVAAPAFIAAATGRKIYQKFELAGKDLHVTDVTICPTGDLVGQAVGRVQADHLVNIVMHHGLAGANINPGHDLILAPGDTVLVIAPMDCLIALEARNHSAAGPLPERITVSATPLTKPGSTPPLSA